ncbi:MAG: LAGLIDADG family homing endonuclease [Halodesulfurarchaeum sp.]
MASARDQELADRFETFYRQQYSDAIADLARRYPSEDRSLDVDYQDLFRFDPDFADDLLETPSRFLSAAEEALARYDLPVDKDLSGAHVRVDNLPSPTEIRDIRSEHLGTLIAVQGIVRKATSVKPKIERAAFECLRCGTVTVVPQADGGFQEPYQCDGCEREGPFQFLTGANETEFVDAQKLRIQESPEGLGGGETPESIDMHIEDDITGEVSPGDHVTATGILRLDDSDMDSTDSRVFDMYLEGVSVTLEDEEFEEMEISAAEREEIIRLSEQEDIYERIVDSIAPTIYGFEVAKLAIALQLFSGVTKHLPDGARIRGDVHILLVGDPGTGKCVSADTTVTLADGTHREIRDLVESHLEDPQPVDDGVFAETDFEVLSMTADGSIEPATATKVWKRESPETMYRVSLADGSELEITPSHPLFTVDEGTPTAVTGTELSEGTFVAVPRNHEKRADDTLEATYRNARSHNAVSVDIPDEWTPGLARLIGYIVAEGYAQIRDDNTAYVGITNDDTAVLDDVEVAFEKLGLPVTKRRSHPGKSAKEYICNSSEFATFLKSIEANLLRSSAAQRVPEQIFRASDPIRIAFLKAFIEGEGHVSSKEREISVASVSAELLEDVRSLLVSLGIRAHFEERAGGSYRLRISGSDFDRYTSKIGFVSDRKQASSAAYSDIEANTNTDVIPNVGQELKRVRQALALTQSECGLPRTTFQHYERGDRNPGRASLEQVLDVFEERLDDLEATRERLTDPDWETVEQIRTDLGLSQKDLADEIGVEQTTVSMYGRGEILPDGGRVRDAVGVLREHIDAAVAEADTVRALKRLVSGDLAWTQITDIEPLEPDEEWVYDLEVDDTHSYLSNDVLSHNSQILQYIRHISPRSVYTSGKGSSSAGLTAAAVRDDFGDGQQWSLEAGALVLADKGVAAVDELDKMACVTGDTLVSLADGEIERIGELAREAAAAGSIEALENGRTIRDLPELTVRTMTEDGSIEERPVTAIHEYDAPSDLCEVTLETGESLTATPDHPFFVWEDGERVEREAAALEPGASVFVPQVQRTAPDGGTTTLGNSNGGIASAPFPDVEVVPVESVTTRARAAVPGSPGHIYDLTVEGTHNFVANGMVVHNSDDRSAMHEALEQQSYHPNTGLSLADGRQVEIGPFVEERLAAREADVVEGVDCEILPVDDVAVHSADMDSGEIAVRNVDRISRHEAPEEFVRVSFSNGETVTVTPEHPMFVEAGNGIETIPASEVTADHSVPAPADLPTDPQGAETAPGDAFADGGVRTGRSFSSVSITQVETVPNEGEHATDWVYDVTVEPTNTFVSQGVILHNSISISKAGINATLKSRCALLGAANPELGRFDRYETPANQIDLEPALISRFDLIFTVTDQPDAEKDANLAEHILNTNYAGELNTHRTQVETANVSAQQVEDATRDVAPAIEPDLMRKYIAYARSTCFPTMSEEAESRIQEFYVNLRAQGTGEDSPVPVTARKLEAIVRLAEASARVRLSDTVEPEDADRALEIVDTTLKEIGMDPETGQYDADVIETGQSKSQRDRIRTIKELIEDVEAEFDEGAPVEEILARAEEVDMDRSKAEHEIEKLKQQGEVYEPSTGHLRTT